MPIPANTPSRCAGYRHRLASASTRASRLAIRASWVALSRPVSLLSSIAAKAGSTHAASASGSQRVMLSGAGATAPSPRSACAKLASRSSPRGVKHADAGHNDPLRRCKIRHIGIDTVVAYALVFFGSGSSPLFFARIVDSMSATMSIKRMVLYRNGF